VLAYLWKQYDLMHSKKKVRGKEMERVQGKVELFYKVSLIGFRKSDDSFINEKKKIIRNNLALWLRRVVTS
jgi:hypothetical protein